MDKFKKQNGQLAIGVIFFAAVAVTLATGFIFLASSFLQLSVRGLNKSQAFAISEAGIEYYRWHLAHAPQDFQDGTGQGGPYLHTYYNKDSTALGQFSLDITPPPIGSTVVKVRSTGSIFTDSSIKKIIEVEFGTPSIAKYFILSNDNLYFATNTAVYGQVMANDGIHFDGVAYNVVMSAKTSYQDPIDATGSYFGVHTDVPPADPFYPAPLPSRPDVFTAGRQFPLPQFDFLGLTSVMANIKTLAQSGGVYLASSTKLGYHLVLKTDNTFDVYVVSKLVSKPTGCSSVKGKGKKVRKKWELWSIQTESFLRSYQIPANGIVFAEDDVWVDGKINGSRLTIAVAQFPEQSDTTRSITVNHNLQYTNYDGTDVIGLFAQEDVAIGFVSDDVLRIDAAVIAKTGEFGRFYYIPPNNKGNGCNPYQIRSSLTTYGMMASYDQPEFSFSDGTGYQSVQNIYDAHLLYNPPPSFPLTGSEYTLISWHEVQ